MSQYSHQPAQIVKIAYQQYERYYLCQRKLLETALYASKEPNELGHRGLNTPGAEISSSPSVRILGAFV